MKQIGITETYDPCFVSDWETKLLDVNIIISKELSDEMIEKLLIVQDKVIFHHTVTGQGGTILEPGVKTPEFEFEQFKKLMDRGFDPTHYVLRIDPMIMFIPENIKNIKKVLDMWSDYCKEHSCWLRCRVSIVDLYGHAKKRLTDAGVVIPWDSFTAPQMVFDKAEEILYPYDAQLVFECCAEQNFSGNFIHRCGCASIVDVKILGVEDKNSYGMPESKQRKDCMCLAKKQILSVKPGRCPHQCLYCFWK